MLRRFRFLDPGPLVDGELELVAPTPGLIEAAVASEDEVSANLLRAQTLAFLQQAPLGREPGSFWSRRVPSYHFWMRLNQPNAPVPIAGGVGLRIGDNRDLRRYVGHIGYKVFRRARGHGYAERSVRLILPLARRHGLKEVWITANPDNTPSRRTIEKLGGVFVDHVRVPEGHILYKGGEKEKARYRLDLTGAEGNGAMRQ